jgi:dienelactone hydrolase
VLLRLMFAQKQSLVPRHEPGMTTSPRACFCAAAPERATIVPVCSLDESSMSGLALERGGPRLLIAPMLLALCLSLLCVGRAVAGPHTVAVPSLAVRGPADAAVSLPGYWFAAEPRGGAPIAAPAMVLMHGCGGVFDGRGQLGTRYTGLAATLNRLGVHVLVTDSLTPRGEKELCTQKTGQRRITQLDRRRDALGALAWLAQQTGVDPQRLGLLGWSNGGSTVLAATNKRHAEVRAATVQPSLAVAYYPGCESELQRGYEASAPLLMLLGEADDWTPAGPCKAMAAAASAAGGAGAALQWEAYIGAHHGFDGTAPVRHRADVPNGVRPGAGVHAGGQPEARAASQARLIKFLQETWKLNP